MKWPRGRYNGQRIVGFEVTVKLNIKDWTFIPRNPRYSHCFHWLCVRVWLHASYDQWEHIRG
jgi:hypothetical protein